MVNKTAGIDGENAQDPGGALPGVGNVQGVDEDQAATTGDVGASRYMALPGATCPSDCKLSHCMTTKKTAGSAEDDQFGGAERGCFVGALVAQSAADGQERER